MPELNDIRAALAQLPDPVALLESLFRKAPFGLQIYDKNGRSLLVNQAFLDLFGSQPPPEYNVLKDEIAAQRGVLDLIRRAFQGETVAVPPVWYDPRDLTQVKVEQGNRVAIQATFVPLLDAQGAVSHVAIVFKDMTREMVHAEQLEEERELLGAIIDQVTEGIAMVDSQGIVRLANRTAREIGTRIGARTQDPIWQRALSGETATSLVTWRGRTLNTVAVPLRRADGSVRGAVTTFRDETERARRDEENRQAAHFRERFIGILGHDLRSPLTAIGASAGLLLRIKDAAPAVHTAATRIAGSTDRMGRMIRDLLDFTQARLGGGLAVQRKPVDLREVVRISVDEVLAGDPSRIIQLTVDGDVSGNFDPDRAAQLFSNLLTNAMHHGPPDRPIEVTLRPLDGSVEIAVTNEGPEIAAADRAVIFDAFRRGSAASLHRGLGLGLFIVQQIARAHGGDASVESGGGRTTFRARLQR